MCERSEHQQFGIGWSSRERGPRLEVPSCKYFFGALSKEKLRFSSFFFNLIPNPRHQCSRKVRQKNLWNVSWRWDCKFQVELETAWSSWKQHHEIFFSRSKELCPMGSEIWWLFAALSTMSARILLCTNCRNVWGQRCRAQISVSNLFNHFDFRSSETIWRGPETPITVYSLRFVDDF